MKRSVVGISATAVAAGVVSALVVAALATADNPRRSATNFDHLSNAGVQRPSVAARDADVLRSGGGQPTLNVLGEREGFAFYTAPSEQGGLCFGAGAAETGNIGVLFCPNTAAVNDVTSTFPSNEAPILDMSGQALRRDSQTFLELKGFAAGGVAKVGVIDRNGVLYAAPVADNIYSRRELPRVVAKALVAFDSSGAEIFRRELGAP